MDEIYSISDELGNYSVSNYGNVINKTTGYLLQHMISKNIKSHNVQLCNKGKSRQIAVHRLVAFIYTDNPKCDPFVRHKDKDKSNNYYKNLEWFNNGGAPTQGFDKKYMSINY